MRSIDLETCDRCGPAVRAAVLVRNIPILTEHSETGLPNFGYHGELTFCGHHGDKYELTFAAAGYVVTDYRLIQGGVAA